MRNDIRSTPIKNPRARLTELRLKTDRDLTALVEKALEWGFQLIRRGDKDKAESTYTQAAAIMPLLRALSATERQRLKRRVRELRAELDQQDPWKRLAS